MWNAGSGSKICRKTIIKTETETQNNPNLKEPGDCNLDCKIPDIIR